MGRHLGIARSSLDVHLDWPVAGRKLTKGKGALEMTVAYSLCAAEGMPITAFDFLFDSFDLDLSEVFDFNS